MFHCRQPRVGVVRKRLQRSRPHVSERWVAIALGRRVPVLVFRLRVKAQPTERARRPEHSLTSMPVIGEERGKLRGVRDNLLRRGVALAGSESEPALSLFSSTCLR